MKRLSELRWAAMENGRMISMPYTTSDGSKAVLLRINNRLMCGTRVYEGGINRWYSFSRPELDEVEDLNSFRVMFGFIAMDRVSHSILDEVCEIELEADIDLDSSDINPAPLTVAEVVESLTGNQEESTDEIELPFPATTPEIIEDDITGEVVEETVTTQESTENSEIRWPQDMKERIHSQMKTLLLACKIYNNLTDEALWKMINISEKASIESGLYQMFCKHPNYNGNLQLVFTDKEYQTRIGTEVIDNWFYQFKDFFASESLNKMEDHLYAGMTYCETKNSYKKIADIIDEIQVIKNIGWGEVSINGNGLNHYIAEKERFANRLKWFKENPAIVIVSNKAVLKIDNDKRQGFYEVCNYLRSYTEKSINENAVNYIKNRLDINIVAGQKTTRVVNKILNIYPWVSDKVRELKFEKYADAINPVNLKGKTVLSINPIDYLTMSFGTSWRSCHNLDKELNAYAQSGQYSNGCCATGTMSYMMDGTSMVFYVTDRKETIYGNIADEYELALIPKKFRNMFHYGNDKLVQGRVYPQGEDSYDTFYGQFRAVVQEAVAKMLGADDSWVINRGTNEVSQVTDEPNGATHYMDYTHFSQCNVSTIKINGHKSENRNVIMIGHKAVCPSCGIDHINQEQPLCSNCRRDGHGPVRPGTYLGGNEYLTGLSITEPEVLGETETHESEGFFCAYCAEWHEIDDDIVVIGDRYYCDSDCAERDDYVLCNDNEWHYYEDVYTCDRCGCSYYLDNDGREVYTHDLSFCDSDCAEDSGYHEVNGEWYYEDELVECDHCGEYIVRDNDDYIITEDGYVYCCEDCAERDDYKQNNNGEWVSR